MANEIERYLTGPWQYDLHLDYHFGGYAKTTPELIRFIKEFIASSGIMVEPVYTAKMLYAVYDLIAENHFEPGCKILAIHTGGMMGLMGLQDKFV